MTKSYLLGANFVLCFFQFGQICVWEILNIYFEGKFFLRAFSKYMKGFFNHRVGVKLLNFGVITVKLGVFIKLLVIKII